MDNDEDLRARFKTMAREDAAAVPELGRRQLDHRRTRERARRSRRIPYSVGALAACVATIALAARRSPEPEPPIDLPIVTWVAPSDFLLQTPDLDVSDLTSSVPEHVTEDTVQKQPR